MPHVTAVVAVLSAAVGAVAVLIAAVLDRRRK
jgi:hypothetical protein